VEQLTYRELLGRLPETAYYASFRMHPGDNLAAMQMDLSLAFPMIDLLLGGQGSNDDRVREITEIEEQILEVVARIVAKELGTAWIPLGIEFAFDGRQQASQLQRLMPPTEKILSLSFELRMSNSRGSLNLTFSAVASNALQRKLSKDWDYRRPSREADADGRLKHKLLDCRFSVMLGAVNIPIAMTRLLDLRPGDVLPLRHPVDAPLALLVAGHPSFTARAVRSSNLRAAQVFDRSIVKAEKVQTA